MSFCRTNPIIMYTFLHLISELFVSQFHSIQSHGAVESVSQSVSQPDRKRVSQSDRQTDTHFIHSARQSVCQPTVSNEEAAGELKMRKEGPVVRPASKRKRGEE